MGATDSANAEEGTIRKDFGASGENATHGSDSDENAAIEIAYFLAGTRLGFVSGQLLVVSCEIEFNYESAERLTTNN